MGKLRQAIKSLHDKAVGRPTPNSPKAGYTSDGSKYGKGGKLRKKKC